MANRCVGHVSSLAVVACLLLPSVILQFFVQPAHRGFICGDFKLSYPYRREMIPYYAVVIVDIFLPIIVIFLIEYFHPMNATNKKYLMCRNDGNLQISEVNASSVIERLVKYISILFVTVATAELFTDLIAYYTGYQRPYFLDVCGLKLSEQNCSSLTYIEMYECSQSNKRLVKEARLSFPSGHASVSMASMLFTVLYIHLRLGCTHKWMMAQSAFSVTLVAIAVFFGCASTNNNAHHVEDVVSGFALGAIIPVMMKSWLM